ncbi:MAG: 5,6-dimethylbenzimidazole synthase [Cenarchaeum sp. SB0665_bin_23]|nr:5,6-dimethylbenzimidazole synthase [Cenarchaeum sp. SB0667_bin_13]MXY61097.1 5,6-dimethylbenzimidazole synthase [Cenarchaeum sp. SB0665_bin_23]MXZ93871.1 5,6-dimethylbenzimidazole synthase [Cenarchaeum sp. SB0666_bin_15]MYB46356.1 5,6-dimethylbenzimidazole synthase [Cenarchaeum sp. SB0662_bin_33]MYC79861.1 5,6-dimethylbenzimidazole synthase [Cenarchaeum sp. SB0661_bin_35]MYD58049.1 5,6-dimethylbenzimidazole synthase [Cenarchaeum sp. SB0678_bin_8]MYG32421.1 5,6-dimethylbenzimidazole synthas
MDFTEEEKSGLYKAIHTRRDVRSHFTKKPIPTNILARILHAAHHAPSVGFSQPWNFILIKSTETREAIKGSFQQEKERTADMVEEPRRSQYVRLKLEGIMESYLNICVTYDPTRFGPFVIGRESIPQTGIYSVCCAIQNLWLAARTEGVGLGWVSILSNDTIKRHLELPSYVEPVAYLCLGYVDEFSTKPDLESAGWLPRMNLKNVINYEIWNGKSNIQWSELDKTLGDPEYA